MEELLNVPGTQLYGETNGGGILWTSDDAFGQVMGLECPENVRGSGFWKNPIL